MDTINSGLAVIADQAVGGDVVQPLFASFFQLLVQGKLCGVLGCNLLQHLLIKTGVRKCRILDEDHRDIRESIPDDSEELLPPFVYQFGGGVRDIVEHDQARVLDTGDIFSDLIVQPCVAAESKVDDLPRRVSVQEST